MNKTKTSVLFQRFLGPDVLENCLALRSISSRPWLIFLVKDSTDLISVVRNRKIQNPRFFLWRDYYQIQQHPTPPRPPPFDHERGGGLNVSPNFHPLALPMFEYDFAFSVAEGICRLDLYSSSYVLIWRSCVVALHLISIMVCFDCYHNISVVVCSYLSIFYLDFSEYITFLRSVHT